ncbi:MAG: hypothetical protein ACLQU5_25730 [Isosphaeraceae bacterium]
MSNGSNRSTLYCTTGREQNQQYGDLTDLVMERRGRAMVVNHNAMPADSTVASTLRH